MTSPTELYILHAITIATALGLPVLLLVIWRRYKEKRRRWDHDLCPDCGYDLRGSATTCPECGRPIRKNL